MIMNKKEKKVQEQNEFLQGLIESFEDIKAGRVYDIKYLGKNKQS